MSKSLYQHFNHLVLLTEAEFAPIAEALTSRSLTKKELLLRAGEVCPSISFVEQGLVRVFTIDAKGTEFIDQFAFEGWWVGDLYSFLTREPGTYTIEALEPTQVLQLGYEAVQHLLDTLPKYERYFRLQMQNNYVATHRRLNLAVSRPAEDKYEALLTTYPAVTQRVPQHMIAAYLGVTPEFLSRMRTRRLRKSS